MWARSLGWEDLLVEGMATHSSILAWRIPWTEKPGGLQCIGLQRVRHHWNDLAFAHRHLRPGYWQGWLLLRPLSLTCCLLPVSSHGPPSVCICVLISFYRHHIVVESILMTSFSLQFSCSVVSFWPHGLQHARLPCPSPTPGAGSNSCSLSSGQLSHPLSSPSPPEFNLSQHQSLFQWVSSLHFNLIASLKNLSPNNSHSEILEIIITSIYKFHKFYLRKGWLKQNKRDLTTLYYII